MIAKDIISDTIPALKTSDTGMKALYWMDIFRISHLPIVNNKQFLGLISDKDIYDLNMAEEPIGDHQLSLITPFVMIDSHIIEVIGLAAKLKLSVVPVLDEKEEYLGVITKEEMLHYMAELSSFEQPGGVIVLEINEIDYSLSQIAQIAESNDMKILSLYLKKIPETTLLEVYIKLNRLDLSAVLQTFERYDYKVKANYSTHEEMNNLYENRYDEFIRYLNI